MSADAEAYYKQVEADFDEWLEDPFTHWTCDTDAAWQAWMEQQERITYLENKLRKIEEQDRYGAKLVGYNE